MTLHFRSGVTRELQGRKTDTRNVSILSESTSTSVEFNCCGKTVKQMERGWTEGKWDSKGGKRPSAPVR